MDRIIGQITVKGNSPSNQISENYWDCIMKLNKEELPILNQCKQLEENFVNTLEKEEFWTVSCIQVNKTSIQSNIKMKFSPMKLVVIF